MGSRRQYLQAASAAVTLGIGGCLADLQAAANEVEGTPTPGQTPTQTATAAPMPPVDASNNPRFPNPGRVEQLIHRYVNRERMKRDRGALVWSPELAYVARRHSRDMVNREFLSHENPDGASPEDRVEKYNLPYNGITENIAMTGATDGKSPAELAKYVVQMWMDSEKGHRFNLLLRSRSVEGIGVFLPKEGGIWATQLLAYHDRT